MDSLYTIKNKKMENEKKKEMAKFLLMNKILEVTGYKPNLENVKTNLEQELGREIFLKIIDDKKGYIKGTFKLEP